MSNPTAKEIAAKLLDLFGPNGEHWTQSEYARRADGMAVQCLDQEACRWCMSGGIPKVYDTFAGWTVNLTLLRDALADVVGTNRPLPRFNDSQPWPVVKAALERVANG